MANKLLVAIFAIVLIIVAAEVGYYFFYQPQITTPPKKNGASTPTKTLIGLTDSALSPDTLSDLLYTRRGVLTASILNNKYQGEIVELITTGGIIPKNQSPYQVKIKIQGEQGAVNVLYLGASDLALTKMYQINKDGKQLPINISDLQIGNKVIIEITLDLTKDPNSNTMEIKITRI